MYLLSIACVILMTGILGFVSGMDVGNLFDGISLLLLLLFLIPCWFREGFLRISTMPSDLESGNGSLPA